MDLDYDLCLVVLNIVIHRAQPPYFMTGKESKEHSYA